MEDDSRLVTATGMLTAALDRAAQAMAGASLDELLAAEQALAHAFASFPHSLNIKLSERPAIKSEVDMVRASLRRCRRLGQALGDFVRISFSVNGQDASYRRDGAAGQPKAAPAFEVRG